MSAETVIQGRVGMMGGVAGNDGGAPRKDPAEGLNIYQRIREIKREVHGVDKNGRHGQGFAFTRHDDVTAALGPLYVKWGVDREVTVDEAMRVGGIIGMTLTVSWVNVDDPKDRKSVKVFAEGIDVTKRDGSLNTDGLAAGKGISYAVKTAELKNFCLVGDTTPDSEKIGQDSSIAAPTDDEYKQLKELYESCSSQAEFEKIRKMLVPLVTNKKLSGQQVAELSKLDLATKERLKAQAQ